MAVMFKPFKVTSNQLGSLSIVEGRFIICTDTGEMYLDTDSTHRIQLSGSDVNFINTLQTSININDYLNYGKYAIKISNTTTGSPISDNNTYDCLLETISTYKEPNDASSFPIYIKQRLYIPQIDTAYYRIITYTSSSSITYGSWNSEANVIVGA